MIVLNFIPHKVPPGTKEITLCQYEHWPDGKKRTEHYRIFDEWIRKNRPEITQARYHCWPYSGEIICE